MGVTAWLPAPKPWLEGCGRRWGCHSLPNPGMQGIIHILEVGLLHPLVLWTKAMGLIGLLVVISLLEPGGEGIQGYIKVLGNLDLGVESLLHLQDGLVFCLECCFCIW